MALLSIRSAVRSTYTAYKQHLGTLLGAGLILGGVQMAYYIVMHIMSSYITPGLQNTKYDSGLLTVVKKWFLANSFSVEYFSGSQIAVMSVFQLVGLLIGCFLYYGLVALTLAIARGRPVSLKDMFIAQPVFVRLLLASGAYLVSFFSLFALAIVACLISAFLFFRTMFIFKLIGFALIGTIVISFFALLITYSLFMFCSADRPTTPFGALKVSACLLQGLRLKMAGLFLSIGFIGTLYAKIMHIIFTSLPLRWISQDALLFSTAYQLVITPCVALIFAYIYVHLITTRQECQTII